jgi:hypothetical protein
VCGGGILLLHVCLLNIVQKPWREMDVVNNMESIENKINLDELLLMGSIIISFDRPTIPSIWLEKL